MGENVASNGATGSRYDVVISGGEVVDPGSAFSGNLDVAIAGGKIAAIEAGIDPGSAKRIDATGQYVTPGLIDLHTHVYWGATYWGIEPDPVAARSGVTTWLDVGSSGSYSFPGFREYIVKRSKSRVYALLNLSAIGLIAPTYEFANLDYCDVELAATIVEENRDVILGIKARIDKATTRGVGIRPLAIARELADRVGLPLMIHIGQGPPTIEEVIPHLRPGDILTHCFTGHDMRILGDDELILPAIKDLHDRGLILDIGHGAGSFSFRTARHMLDQGIKPDVISTDIHQLAIQGPMFDMPTTLSKFLNLGMSLADVIECATSRPAAAMRKPELGSLKPSSPADVALFRIEEGDFTFQDIFMNELQGTKRLVNTLTMIDGEVLPRLPERKLHPWAVLPDHQRGKLIPLVPVPEAPTAPELSRLA
ncbi:MAG TPA: amidohydrolase/deacetylase family metallohydrolase [Thermomicrobiales bacterium]|nr:amidohydrolase/deacetylase family metallohydrolase [Thermomicrobiales bacterium]